MQRHRPRGLRAPLGGGLSCGRELHRGGCSQAPGGVGPRRGTHFHRPPRRDFGEYCRRVRDLAPAVRIVATSTLNSSRLFQEHPGLQAIVDGVLRRPYGPEEVTALLAPAPVAPAADPETSPAAQRCAPISSARSMTGFSRSRHSSTISQWRPNASSRLRDWSVCSRRTNTCARVSGRRARSSNSLSPWSSSNAARSKSSSRTCCA